MIDPDALLAHSFPEIRQLYGPREAILYALGAGVGLGEPDSRSLRLVYETQMSVLPSFSTVLSAPGFWWREPWTGADWPHILHGEQRVELIEPLPARAEVVSQNRVIAVVDKGAGKPAFVYQRREIKDAQTGQLYVGLNTTSVLRRDGGCGSAGTAPPPSPHSAPDRPADMVLALPTSVQAALIYRLCGDENPIHIDPAVARAAGFERPILHGLSTFGVATHGLVRVYCDYAPDRLRAIQARFSAPVYPGDTIRLEMWRTTDGVVFSAWADERNVQVLKDGFAVTT
jgi:acyl dehydratase